MKRNNLLTLAVLGMVFNASTIFAQETMPTNVALNKKVTVSGVEHANFPAEFLIDGKINRQGQGKEQSRWASDVKNNQEFKNNVWQASAPDKIIWANIDLGKVEKNICDLRIHWEVVKAIDYSILASDDGVNWKKVWESKKKALSPTENIRLNNPIQARYIKLEINKFNRESWANVSIFEIEVFNGRLPQTIETFIAEFSAEKNIELTKNKLIVKGLPKGVTAKIIGTTYEQVIDFDGTIYPVLSDITTVVTFELTDGQKNFKTESFPLTIKAEAALADANAKPAVIPALQEWAGAKGNWAVPESISMKINAKSDSKAELEKMMAVFIDDYQNQTGKKLKQAKFWGNAAISVTLLNSKDKLASKLGKEGYNIKISPKGIQIIAVEPVGAFWATRTILQILKNNQNATLPCGEICDYPQYPVRGFMFDIGRKPVNLDTVRDVMKMMSWYKMNDLQLHLNDNFIWLHDYTKIPNDKKATAEQKEAALKEVLDAAPTAFRLESNMVGKNGVKLTCESHYYTKEEFGQLIDLAEQYGVNIVPEFDVPGHAMSFVRVRPDLVYRGTVHKAHDVERAAMLNASSDIFDPVTGKTYREETLDFVKKVFDEYLTSENGKAPVFRKGVVHIGTDEYYGNAEDYRWFADALLKYVKSKGFTPRLWGSLTAKKGKTPVISEGVQMHIWSRDWQRPLPAIEAGYDIINILDADMYIVPNGNGGTGAYNDYISLPNLYNPRWQPHVMQQYKAIPGHPQVLGAQFAVWNDNAWRRDSGLTDYDLYDRIERTACVLAEKTWNNGIDRQFDQFYKLYEQIGTYPSINPRYLVDSKTNVVLDMNFDRKQLTDNSGNNYNAQKSVNTSFVSHTDANNSALKLTKNSFVKMPISNLAPNYVVEFMVRRDSNSTKEQILFSSSIGQFKAVQKETGKIGFSRESWDFSFDYTLPVGEWVKVRLEAEGRKLNLFINDKKIGSPKRHLFPNSYRFATFVFPLEYIGAPKNSFEGSIDDLKIIKK